MPNRKFTNDLIKKHYTECVNRIKQHYRKPEELRTESIEEWLQQHRKFWRHPEYIAEGVSLSVIQQIHEAMEAQDMTRDELAKITGTSRQFIHQLMSGECGWTIRTIAKIAAALGFNHIELRMEYVEPDE